MACNAEREAAAPTYLSQLTSSLMFFPVMAVGGSSLRFSDIILPRAVAKILWTVLRRPEI